MKIMHGKPRQCGASRFVAFKHDMRMWEVMFPGTPYPLEWGPVLTKDGLVTLGVRPVVRHLPVPASHYNP